MAALAIALLKISFKSSCTICTLRFKTDFRLALASLATFY